MATSLLAAPSPQLTPTARWILDAIEDIEAPALDFSCHSCAAPLSWRQWLNGHDIDILERCACGAIVYSESFHTLPPAEAFERVTTHAYLETTWYHASTQKDWAPQVRKAQAGSLLVHAGSYLAALSRADDIYADMHPGRQKSLYLHSFQLCSTARFAPVLLEDAADAWQERLTVPEPMAVCGAAEEKTIILTPDGYHGAPYYNRYELPGEVSILFHSKLIALSTVETVVLYRP